MTDSNTNFNQNSAKIYTGSAGGELYISTNTSKQTISASNNRSQYYAEQAKKYRDEAKLLRDDTKYYAEQNSDVTVEFVDNVKAELLNVISTKQDSGDYALKSELPINVSELENDSVYVTNSEFPTLVEEFLPEQENNSGKFLMTNENELSWQSILGFSLFDTILKDHVLTYEESKGLALQGTYVYKEAVAGSRYGYPDFYAKCLEEYTEATSTETVNDVEVKVHSNGHKFYNISDKTAIDDFFNSMGSAWFYGVDTENERIFLPRNNNFEQVASDVSEVGQSVEAGLPNITGDVTINNGGGSNGQIGLTSPIGAFSGSTTGGSNAYTSSASGKAATTQAFLKFEASYSNSIYGNSSTVQPNAVKKLLYICVGNTTNYEGMTEVVNQGMEILEQVSQKVNIDGSNLNSEGKSLIAGYAMPSNKYVNLELGASGTVYTAPANGYFGLISHTAGSTATWVGSVSVIGSNDVTFGRIMLSAYNYANGGAFIPVTKGMKIQLEYQNTVVIDGVKFVYAEGEN